MAFLIPIQAVGVWLLTASVVIASELSSFHIADQSALRSMLPAEAYHADARTYGRLNNDSEYLFLFAAVPAYVPALPALAQLPADLYFWQRQAQQWQPVELTIHHAEQACLHPRQVASGDLNGDQLLDLVIACSGDKSKSTQGELPMLLIQQKDGNFALSRPDVFGMARWQAVALADLTGNGAMDIILAGDHQPIHVFYNDGFGQFQAAPQPLFSASTIGYQAIELIDLDGDGQLDLLSGGNNQTSAIWLNNGYGQFEHSLRYHLPKQQNYPLVTDFYWDQNDNRLYLLRTSETYEGTALQSVHWPSLTAQTHWADPNGQWQSKLVATEDEHGVLLSSDQLDSPYRHLIE